MTTKQRQARLATIRSNARQLRETSREAGRSVLTLGNCIKALGIACLWLFAPVAAMFICINAMDD